MKTNVLVLDDDPIYLQVLESACSLFGYRTFSTSNINQALSVLRNQKIEMLIADRMLETESVFALLETCESDFPDIALVLISGFWSVADRDRAQAHRARHLLVKPFSLPELKAALEHALVLNSIQSSDYDSVD